MTNKEIATRLLGVAIALELLPKTTDEEKNIEALKIASLHYIRLSMGEEMGDLAEAEFGE